MLVHSVSTLFNLKLYRFVVGPVFLKYAPLSLWFEEVSGLHIFSKKSSFIRGQIVWGHCLGYFRGLFTNFSLYASILMVKWFRFVLFSGLGYKRRFHSNKRIMFTYIGDRHWILYKFPESSVVIPTKKRNFIFFSSSKNSFAEDYNFFSSLRRPYVYKMKGFLDRRVKRRFLFVRRIRLRGLKMKLSKKQLML